MERQVQLFLLPFAGGSSLSFMKLMRFIDKRIETIPIEYSGRGKRKEDPIITDYKNFFKDVQETIQKYRNRTIPYAIFGYSMGSVLGFDISAKMSVPPCYSFFCAEGGLISDNPARKYGLLDDEIFLDKIIGLGGLDQRILSNNDILKQTIQLVKGDYMVLSDYHYDGTVMYNDASIIYGVSDKTSTSINEWNKVISGKTDYYQMKGGHFFIQQYFREIAQIVNLKLLGK